MRANPVKNQPPRLGRLVWLFLFLGHSLGGGDRLLLGLVDAKSAFVQNSFRLFFTRFLAYPLRGKPAALGFAARAACGGLEL